MKTQFSGFVCSIIVGMGTAPAQNAASYPAKPIRVISPYNPGVQSDTLMRAIGEQLTARWGQPVIIENRRGGGGNIGADYVARQAPDGYTLPVGDMPEELGVLIRVEPAKWSKIIKTAGIKLD